MLGARALNESFNSDSGIAQAMLGAVAHSTFPLQLTHLPDVPSIAIEHREGILDGRCNLADVGNTAA
jgi:hypothetical protein